MRALPRFLRRLLGLERWKPLEVPSGRWASLSLKYLTFKDLVQSNDEVLEIITDIEQKLRGESLVGMTYVRSRTVACATHVYQMIQGINKLSARRYQELHFAFDAIQKEIDSALDRSRKRQAGPLVYPLTSVDLSLADRVGGKSANLGEVLNRVGLSVPDGFAISTDAFEEYLEENQLKDELHALQVNLDPENVESLQEASQAIAKAIFQNPLPPSVEEAILGAYGDLSARLGYPPRVSLRSSAVGEDSEISFAGQYVSVLNVPGEWILDSYREVVAGLYTPRAIYYRIVHGIPEEDVPMGVACISMVEAVASGVACSVDPNRPGASTVVINSAWGLGTGTVGGSVSPDFWEVAKTPPHRILRRRAGLKETRAQSSPAGGLENVPVAPDQCSAFSLEDARVSELARLACACEGHYGKPQELEWAVDAGGRLFVLQSRPLRTSATEEAAEEPPPELEGHPLLLRGTPASPGASCGPVFRVLQLQDLAAFPRGAVLVARHSSPQFVKVMRRAAAIVTDIGATTGHMASLAREFGLPAVLDTRKATTLLQPGQRVTVDARRGGVYDGCAQSLLATPEPARVQTLAGTPMLAILEEVSRRIVPLNLTDRRSAEFRASNCRTFHDIARFVHEKAFEEMFRISDQVVANEYRTLRLQERLPFEVYLIDLGGGLEPDPSGAVVLPSHIRSEPMQALLKGMTHPGLKWWEPRPISLGGFMSVAAESLFTPAQEHDERRIGDKSYAVVADAYCNFSSRIGYHFTAVDAYVSDQLSRNYVSFRFKGGAADEGRRAKRCEMIGAILKRLDFAIERHGDLINGRMRKFDRETLLDRLDALGKVIVATRQLDMRMGPTTRLEWYVDAFFEGNYLFDPDFRAGRGDDAG